MTDLRARAALAALLITLGACATGQPGSSPFGLGRLGIGRRVAAAPTDTVAAPLALPTPALPPRDDPEPPPTASDSAGVARLLQLARVWQLITLHHPWVAARGIPMDSAYVHAAPLVRRASDPDTLALAYRRFLAVLDDSLTQVEIETEHRTMVAPAEPEPARIEVETTRDSVLLLRIPPATRYSDQAEVLLRDALRALPTTRTARVVLDLRGTRAVAADSLDALFTRVALVEQLSALPTSSSAIRVRRVGGARETEGAITTDDGWVVQDGALSAGRRTRPAQVVVLVNAATTLPLRLLGFLAHEGATLVAEGSASDALLVPSTRVSIGAGLVVRIRTGELVHPDGRVGMVPDTIVVSAGAASTSADSAPALRAALQRVRSSARSHIARMSMRGPAVFPARFDTSAYPVMGARLLAGARVWHLMQARHAHRELYDDDIDERFGQLIPLLERSRTAHEYARALEGFVSAFDDGQVVLRGASVDSLRGVASLPFRVRWMDGRAIITDVIRDSTTRALGIEFGHELTAIDGFPLPAWLSEHRRTVSATNEWTRTQLLMDRLIRGPRGGTLVRLRDSGGRERQLTVPRAVAYPPLLPLVERASAATARSLPSGVLYLDVNRLNAQTVEPELTRLRTARALIIDLRGSLAGERSVESRLAEESAADVLRVRLLAALRRVPVAVVAQELHRYRSTPCLAPTLREAVQQCSDERVVRARVSRGDTVGTFRGPIVALIDERTRGAMEQLALALATVTDVTFIGSATAGAPADAAAYALPGGLTLTVPLVELRRTDGSQWQRLGITPAIESRLTVRTVRSGGDDVIERAQQWLQRQLDGDSRRR